MESKYTILVNEEYQIISLRSGVYWEEEAIEITQEEYERAKHYRYFNPQTKEFWDEIIQPEVISEATKIKKLQEQVEMLDGVIASLLLMEA